MEDKKIIKLKRRTLYIGMILVVFGFYIYSSLSFYQKAIEVNNTKTLKLFENLGEIQIKQEESSKELITYQKLLLPMSEYKEYKNENQLTSFYTKRYYLGDSYEASDNIINVSLMPDFKDYSYDKYIIDIDKFSKKYNLKTNKDVYQFILDNKDLRASPRLSRENLRKYYFINQQLSGFSESWRGYRVTGHLDGYLFTINQKDTHELRIHYEDVEYAISFFRGSSLENILDFASQIRFAK